MNPNKQFRTVPAPNISRSRLNLSHRKVLSADPFLLYPIMTEPCIPGDKWRISHNVKIRMTPLAAPIYHNLWCTIHNFFVPYRLLFKDWEKYITAGKDGKLNPTIPTNKPKRMGYSGGIVSSIYEVSDNDWYKHGSLADYLGFTTAKDGTELTSLGGIRKKPNVLPLRAYNKIFYDYYVAQDVQTNVQDLIDLAEEGGLELDEYDALDILNFYDSTPGIPDFGLRARCWEKDYFTSMLPFQQRGEAPAFQLTGQATSAQFNINSILGTNLVTPDRSLFLGVNNSPIGAESLIIPVAKQNAAADSQTINRILNQNVIPLNNLGIFDINDLRYGVQLQRFLERMSRGGFRYKEMLQNIWGVNNRDERLQRAEYIGGIKFPIVISEVLQTSETAGEPLGSMAGHGISYSSNKAGNYYVTEHGLIMGILSITADPLYQQGIEKEWTKTSRYELFMQMFQNLGEQAVMGHELYNFGPENSDPIIGYIPRYDEYRHRRSSVHGLFKSDLQYWHMGRTFANQPTLNQDLVRPNRQEITNLKRVLAVPTEPMFLIDMANICDTVRPMPWIAIPGLMDH